MEKPPERKFVVIDGTPAPEETPRDKANAIFRRVQKEVEAEYGPSQQVRCHRCTGLAFIEVRLGMIYRKGKKPSGGQKQLVCATCLQNGEYITW